MLKIYRNFILSAAALSFCALTAVGFDDVPRIDVRNGTFGSLRGVPKTEADYMALVEKGLTCPPREQWPDWWGYYGTGGVFEFPRTGGQNNDPYARISGKDALLVGYSGTELTGDFITTFWARGKGKLGVGGFSYVKVNGVARGAPAGVGLAGVTVEVDSKEWVRHRIYNHKHEELYNIHPLFHAVEGTMDLDTVSLEHATPALGMVVQAETKLRDEGRLVTDRRRVAADDAYQAKAAVFRTVIATFEKAAGALANQALVKSFRALIDTGGPYLLTEGIQTVESAHYNEMLAIIEALRPFAEVPADATAGAKPGVPAVWNAAAAEEAARKSVEITLITPDKKVYMEEDTAWFTVRYTNRSGAAIDGKLTAELVFDLDESRIMAAKDLRLAKGAGEFKLSGSVGPETYGRAIRVTLYDKAGNILDRLEEYFGVAREWARVQMHGNSKYNNHAHFFASEMTDFGAEPRDDVYRYLSGQPLYSLINPHYRARVKWLQRQGIRTTFYVARNFCGPMGYEIMRRHPEFVIHDPNGQFGVDSVYGGYPEPMELDSPIEIDPEKRKALPEFEPHLDLKPTSWEHAIVDFANADALVFGLERMREMAKHYGYSGIYLDDTPVAMGGLDYRGNRLFAGASDAEVAKINARICHLWQSTLKKDDPYFFTWFNGTNPEAVKFMVRTGRRHGAVGMGVPIEEGQPYYDDYIKELTSWKNTSFLFEVQHSFEKANDGRFRYPDKWYGFLRQNRDFMVQTWGGVVVFGYTAMRIVSDDRMAAWPTANYFLAQALATQHHHILLNFGSFRGDPLAVLPGFEPINQFMVRYSRFFWAPDIKSMPPEEVANTVTLNKPETEVYHKDIAYTCDRPDGTKDIIVHLVRPYPLEKWDTDWDVEPAVIADARLTVKTPDGMKLRNAFACRSYFSNEPEQVVQETIVPDGETFALPGFRYHAMVVIRFVKAN